MQKLIIDNKKFSLLVAIIVGFVSLAAFSNAPQVAQAPESNLAAAGTVNTQIVGQASVAPVSFKFFPSVSATARVGAILLFPNYSISIKNGDNVVTEFKVNIQTRVVTPNSASVSWSGVNTEAVTISINDTKILGLFNINTKYSAYISAINDSTGSMSEPLVKTFVTSQVVASATTTGTINTTPPTQTERSIWAKGFARIRVVFIQIITGISDFFSNLFGGSSQRTTTGGSGFAK
jgi:hypothetical protein